MSPPRALIGLDELQLGIPRRVGLHQSPLPLHQPADSMRYSRPTRREFLANGKQCLIRLSQPRGPLQCHAIDWPFWIVTGRKKS